jgi:alpha-glucosidase
LIGEIYLPVERLVAYYGKNLMGAHLPFNFQLLNTTWTAPRIADLIEKYEAALPEGGWPNWVLSNHDRPRIAARIGPQQARVATMLLLTLRGTPTLYYGDELGIGHVEIAPQFVKDPWEKREPGLGLGRDPARTPMQWDASAFAGFSTHEPWLPLTPGYAQCNVMAMRDDKTSILVLVRSLLQYRREHVALTQGQWRLLSRENDILAYERRNGDDRLIVVLNFSAHPRAWHSPISTKARVAISTHGDLSGESVGQAPNLRANEGLLIEAA